MKLLYILLLLSNFCFSQKKYPVPTLNERSLFYIQHSNNTNTFIYEAKYAKGKLDSSDPIHTYRILYEEGGVVKPINALQKKMAYGVESTVCNGNSCSFVLAAVKEHKLFLTTDVKGKYYVYTTVNGKKMSVDHIFIKIKESSTGFNVKAESITFTGKLLSSGKKVSEVLMLKI